VESMISIFEYKRRGREGVETGRLTFCCHDAREKATKRVGRSVDALKQNWPMRIQSCPKGERGDVCLQAPCETRVKSRFLAENTKTRFPDIAI